MSETATQKTSRIDRTLRDLGARGRHFAAQGLNFGKSALENGADRIRKTAEWLGGLSTRVSKPKTDGAPTSGATPSA